MIFQKELLKSLETNGDKIAIELGKESVSYTALLKAANKVTGFLLSKNIEKETLIGIQIAEKTMLIETMIGILNAGCIWVPLDVTLPICRLSGMIRDVNLKHMIVTKQSPAIGGMDDGMGNYFIEDILIDGTLTDEQQIKYPDFNESDSIYIYFTSGTTGKPKGIIGKNSSLFQFVQWEIETFKITSEYRFSQFISPYFDAFLRDVFVPLLSGATICIPPKEEDFFTSEKMIAWLDECSISLIHCVPSLFQQINSNNLTATHLKNLKYVLLSGERILPSSLANWYKTFDERIQIVNLFGATETTMIRCWYKIKPADIHQSRIPIGSPISETEIVISNKDLIPCNTLVPGELCVISAYCTKGYLNAPELMQEKFIPINDTWPSGRVAFKTGDQARILANGKIDLIGRNDRQVKIRGVRIELDELESIIANHGDIENVLVIKNTEENGNEFLVGFITHKENWMQQQGVAESVLKWLKERVPEYMIPSNLMVLTEFPLLDNGKIDHKKLLSGIIIGKIIKPGNETEEKLLHIWKGILGDKEISTEDSFFKLGGNSLTSMRLVAMIYKEFGIMLPLHELFKNHSIQNQSEFIGKALADSIMKIIKAEKKEVYNLSSAQERMYYQYALNRSGTAYNLPMVWEIKHEFDIERIKISIKSLIARNDSLRAEFKYVNGVLSQVIKDTVDFQIEELNSRHLDFNQDILEFIRPFDIEKAPLFRCGVIKIADNRHLLITDMHHIICDGISQVNLYADFLHFYRGENLKPLSVQYVDYAEWENSFKKSAEYLSHKEFWLKSFEGEMPTLRLPITDLTKRRVMENGGEAAFNIDQNSLNLILTGLQEKEITTFSALFSLYLIFLCQFTGQEDIVIGIVTSGRMQHELDGVMGMFVKTLPIRYKINTDLLFKDLALDVHKLLVEANSRQIYDLSDLLSKINAMRSTPVESLFETMFVFQNFHNRSTLPGDSSFALHRFGKNKVKYPITLIANEDDGVIDFRFEYSTSYFTPADIEVIIARFKYLVSTVTENLNGKVQYIIEYTTNLNLIEEDVIFNL